MTTRELHPGERAARESRFQLGLPMTGPVSDLVKVTEQVADLPVLIARFDSDTVAGVLIRGRGSDGDFVAVNADAHSARQRFTLAHELGHVRLGHEGRIELGRDLHGSPRDPQEVEANYFAAEFLAPRNAIRDWLEDRGLVSAIGEPATIARLALTFGIALPTACYRLERAGLISAAYKRRLVDRVQREGPRLVRRFSADRLMDTIESLYRARAYPRVPHATMTYARQALDEELIDEEEYTAITGTEIPDLDLDGWLE